MNSKVVVTGLGVISPIGNNIKEFEQNLFEGVSGATKITRFNPANLPTTIGCQVKNFESEFRDIKISFALEAATQAMNSAFCDLSILDGIDSVLSLGLGLELFSMDDLIRLKNQGYDKIPESDSISFLNTPSDICAHLISKKFNLQFSPLLHISACAAGTDAIGCAFEKVRSGRVKVALAGGADSMINPMGVAGFCRIGAMTTSFNDSPEQASRPFDNKRDGFVLGEGAGFLVLEDSEFAQKRGANILARISGYGNSLDAYSVSEPHPKGAGAIKSMKRALRSAGLSAGDISAVSAHGTATHKNDPAEAQAIRTVLGDSYQNTPVFATKSLMGHLISAAGAVESIASILSLNRNLVHFTKNLTSPGDGCDLCHVMGTSMEKPLKHILKNSFGFGGQNATIIISKDKP